MSSAIVFGIVAAIAYGTANFVARFSGKSLGVLATLLWSQLFLLACATAVFAVIGRLPDAQGSEWAVLAGSNLMIVLGTACLYGGLAKGRLSVVAPVMASYGAVTAGLSLMTGESASGIMMAGLALTVGGAILSALPSKSSQSGAKARTSGIGYALGSALCFGIGYWLQGNHVIPAFGPMATLWLFYVTSTVLFGAVALIRRVPLLTFDGPKDVGLLIATAGLSGGGFAAMMVAQSGGDVAVATALSSAATAITVVLAFAFLKDKPDWKGWLGVAAVVAGVVTLQVSG